MINSRKQTGSALAVIIIVALVAILGILGYVAWNNFFAQKNDTVNTNISSSEEDASDVITEYKTVDINEYTFRYPLNENNQKIIIIDDESTPALQISYVPIRDYYIGKDVSVDCSKYIAGLVNANNKETANEYQYAQRFFGKDSFEEALADGVFVRVGERDLYLSGPMKQNEPCTDIYESTDPTLKTILSETKGINSAWLSSLELVE